MARRALILATGNYDDPELPPLASPVPDGTRLRDLLIRTDVGGYDVTLCENPDLRTARLAIEDFFDDGQREDLNFVLISGHGLKDARGNLHFAMRDTRRKRLSASGLDAHYVRERMRDSRTRQQILCIDTCFSGAFPNDLVPKSGLLDVTAEDLGADGATGTAFITASNSVTVAIEREVAGRTQSVFTRHLIEGIESGAADTQGDGRILLDELFLYVKNQVIAEIPTQTPKIVNGFDGPIAIARNPNYRAAELPAALRKRMDSKVRVQRGMAIEQLHAIAARKGREAPLALDALRRMARDDSDIVRRAAQESLDELTGARVEMEVAESSAPEVTEAAKPASTTPPPVIEIAQLAAKADDALETADAVKPTAKPEPQPLQTMEQGPTSAPEPDPSPYSEPGFDSRAEWETDGGMPTLNRMPQFAIWAIGVLIASIALIVWQPWAGSTATDNSTVGNATTIEAAQTPENSTMAQDRSTKPQAVLAPEIARAYSGLWRLEPKSTPADCTRKSDYALLVAIGTDGRGSLNGGAVEDAKLISPEGIEIGQSVIRTQNGKLLVVAAHELLETPAIYVRCTK